MGKSLFGYQLEGLKRQGSHAVWVPLGVFSTAEDLAQAKSASSRNADLVDFRECAYYLDDCSADRVVRRPAAAKVVFDDTHLLA